MTEEKRKIGRPRKIKNRASFTFRIEAEDKRFLQALADDAKMTLGDFVRDMLHDQVEEWSEMRPDLVIEMKQETKNA